jgi:nitrate/nitrite transporter NarK
MKPEAPVAATASPTHVRYLVVALTTLMAYVLYLDRFCLGFAEQYIREDLRLSDERMSLLLGAFFLAYALGQVPSGWFSDRYGARLMLVLYILAWSLLTGVLGLAMSFLAVLALRLGFGLAQAGAYPTSAGVLSKWVPFAERGLTSGIVSFGGRVGGAAAPVLTAYLILAFVPVSVSSLLRPDDVLDVHALCVRLEQREDTPSGRLSARIRDLLPSDVIPVVRRCGAEGAERRILAESAPQVVEGLNDVLQRRDLYEQLNPDEFPLEREARRLAAIPDDQLTEQQIERRNRLLLEAAYPKEVRKVYGAGWRPVMFVYSGIGLLVAAAFWLGFRNWPQEHPGCNPAEVALIERGRPASAPSPHGRVGGLPLRALMHSRSLWLSSIAQFGTNFGWVFLLLMLPRYLADEHQVPVVQRGWMAGLPIFVGMFGMFGGGWLTDRLTRRVGLRWGRGLPMTLTRFVGVAAYLACIWLRSPWPVTAALAVVAVATDLGTASVWAFTQDVGGRHVGSVLGWGNMWGNFGAWLSPTVLTLVQEAWGWDTVFLSCAGAYLLAGIANVGVDATIPIAPPDAE